MIGILDRIRAWLTAHSAILARHPRLALALAVAAVVLIVSPIPPVP